MEFEWPTFQSMDQLLFAFRNSFLLTHSFYFLALQCSFCCKSANGAITALILFSLPSFLEGRRAPHLGQSQRRCPPPSHIPPAPPWRLFLNYTPAYTTHTSAIIYRCGRRWEVFTRPACYQNKNKQVQKRETKICTTGSQTKG